MRQSEISLLFKTVFAQIEYTLIYDRKAYDRVHASRPHRSIEMLTNDISKWQLVKIIKIQTRNLVWHKCVHAYWLRRRHEQEHHHKMPSIDLIIANYCCWFYNCQLLRPSFSSAIGHYPKWTHTDAAGPAGVRQNATKNSIVVEST